MVARDALAREDGAPAAPALAGDASADVAIVGGGYAGLWTALALAERAPDLRVTLVEAEICGAGPSGRNGGFCHGYWSALSSVLPVLGIGDSLRLCRVGERIVPAVRALGEDVRLRDGGRLDVSAAPAQDGSVDRSVEAAREVGHPEEAVRLSRGELSERIRSPVTRIHYGAGYSGHGVGPSRLGARSSPRSSSAPTTTGRACRSSRDAFLRCRRSRCAASKAGSCARRSWRARKRRSAVSGRRSTRGRGRRSRGCCGWSSGR
jgi:FAD dependent oxidoreductase